MLRQATETTGLEFKTFTNLFEYIEATVLAVKACCPQRLPLPGPSSIRGVA